MMDDLELMFCDWGPKVIPLHKMAVTPQRKLANNGHNFCGADGMG